MSGSDIGRPNRLDRLTPIQRRMRRQRLRAGARGLGPLGHEVLAEEGAVRLVLVKVLGRQHHREHRHALVQLHAHQGVDHRAGDEFVAVDAAIDHQRAGDDGIHRAQARQALGQQRNLECARHRMHRHVRWRARPQARAFGHEAGVALAHDVGVPAGLHEGDARRRAGRPRGGLGWGGLIHGELQWSGLPESGRTANARPHAGCPTRQPHAVALSFIRTVTVGPGIAPGLLTPRLQAEGTGARGLRAAGPIPPVGTSTPP
jgi:hypothetical protein